ncbi:MAG: acyl--CoA ligase [Bacilli bacterium]|nr:acyl--CoA ligase [Bacilli bacterium]
METINYWKQMVGDDYTKIKRFTRMQDLLAYADKEFNQRTAISWKDSKKTYHELFLDVGKTRKVLLDAGIKKGDNVAVIFKNDYNFIKSFFAVTTLGAVAVIVPPILPTQALLGNIKKFNISAIIYGEEAESNVVALKDITANVIYISYKELNDLKDCVPFDNDIKPTDPAVIMFTGGTTGTPKGAVLSHLALLRGAYNGCFVEGQVFFNTYMAIIPFFHVFGLVRNLLTSINTGSEIYLIKETMNFIKEISIAKPNILVLVPALANLLYAMVAKGGKDAVGGRLEYIICGGAYVTPDTIKRLLSVGIKCCPGYGLTETANLVSGSIDYKNKPDSVGKVYLEQEVKIVDGEIWVKGDNLFSGYYKDPIETNHVMSEDGYLKTGDLGHFDEDGFLYITGRSKNIIVLDNGENVSPEIIENALDNIPLVHSSLIYEDKDNQGYGIIAAKIYPNYSVLKKMGYEDANKAIQSVVEKLNINMPQHMRINKVIVLKEDFKRSGSMKIIRNANINS